MRKKLAHMLATVCAAVLLALCCAGCSYDDYEFEEPANLGDSNATWSVLMYVCGSDLESQGGLATDNLEEIVSCDLGDQVHFVVETGGAESWSHGDIDASCLSRYVSTENGLRLVDQLPSASMGDASTLADFIKWGTQACPADRTMLLFWDHGGGSLTGVCADELYPVSKTELDTLTLPEIKKALKAAGAHFDLVGFDTCLMATLECAETVAPYADYLVASEEYEPGGGWAYSAWPEWLARYPGMGTADLGKGICDSYFAKCQSTWTDSMATLSVTDLSKIPVLSDAFRDVSSEIVLTTGDAERFRAFQQSAGRTENYGGNTDAEGYTDMVDLGDLMTNTSGVLVKGAQPVLNALNDAVVYSVHGDERSRAQGLSVFYPLKINKSIYKQYAEITDNTSYLQYLAVLNGDYSALDWDNTATSAEEKLEPVTPDDYKLAYKQKLDDDLRLRLTITSGLEKVASVHFVLGYYDEDTSLYMELGSDNDIKGNWRTGVFTDQFEGTWITIGGAYVNAQLVEETDDHNLYTVPVKINGQSSNLKLVYRYDTGKFEVLGAYDGIDETSGTSGKSMRRLEAGDKISFVFTAASLETGDSEKVDLQTITWSDNTQVKDSDLGDGDYLYMFEIVDMFGETTLTDPVLMHYENGTVSPEELW